MLRVVAKILGFHALAGELKVYPLVDDIEVFDNFDSLSIDSQTYELSSYRQHKNQLLLKLAGINSLSEAEARFPYQQKDIYIEADIQEELASDEYYIEDFKGMSFRDSETAQELGLVETCTEGAQMLLVVRLHAGKRELLVPLVPEYIIEINSTERFIRARLSADFLDLAK